MIRPKGWRKGQTIFNFLSWLKENHKVSTIAERQNDMIDPYYIEDKDWDRLFKDFLKV